MDLSAQTFLKGYDRNRLRRGSLSTSGDGPLLFREAGHTIKDYFVYDTKGSLYPNIPFVVSGAVARRQTRAHDSDVRHRNWRRHNCGQSSLNPCWGLPRCVFAVRPRRTNDRQMMALGAAGGGKGMRPVLVDSWLESKFEDGKSAAKVDPIKRSRANLRADTSNSAFVQRNTYAKHL